MSGWLNDEQVESLAQAIALKLTAEQADELAECVDVFVAATGVTHRQLLECGLWIQGLHQSQGQVGAVAHLGVAAIRVLENGYGRRGVR